MRHLILEYFRIIYIYIYIYIFFFFFFLTGFVSEGQTVKELETAYSVNITVLRTGGSMGVVTINWEASLDGQLLCSAAFLDRYEFSLEL